ncbi:MAG: DUF4139 domain-containing protein [Candidatus Marinimicrobia bacterium]|nr:DUF4139 domain-containing protein [Candidatus Neomarinimicrobiota bacterium]
MQKDRKRIVLLLLICLSLPCLATNEFKNTQVTIYNTNLGLVYQEKEIDLVKGRNILKIEGVSRQVQPATVKLKFPKIGGQYQVQEQNFLYDLVSTSKVFSKYIGEKIELRLESGETISGTLMKQESDRVILSLPNDAVRILNEDKIVDYKFPALPGGLILKPTLEWNVQSDFKGKAGAQLSYLTGGMSWNAEYVLVMNHNEKNFNLNSWISLNNNSGTTFENAKVKLIAGDIHRATKGRGEYNDISQARILGMAQKKIPESREIADYHLYELPDPVTLRDQEMKQVSLFSEIAGSGEKIYIFENNSGNDMNDPLQVIFKIENSDANNMGFALPEGVVRLFQYDSDGSLQFIGEDRIGHTSKKDTLRLIIGDAFDVKGRRTIVEQDRSITNAETMTISITITNRKSKAVNVEVIEYLAGFWNIRKSSHEYRKETSHRIVFPIVVKADSSKTISYTYSRRW